MFFTKDRTEEILDKYLDGDFYVAAAGEGAVSKRALADVGRQLGCAFPKDFIAHSTGRLGGVYVEVKANVWPRPRQFEVGPFWTFLYAVFVYGIGPDVPDWMDLRLAAAKFREDTGHALVPCLKLIGDADLYLFTPDGKIVQWSHETDELTPFAGSFFDLLEREVRDLRERKDKKAAGS